MFGWGVPKSPPQCGGTSPVSLVALEGRSVISGVTLSWGAQGAPAGAGTPWGHRRGLGDSVPGTDLRRRGWERWGEPRDGAGAGGTPTPGTPWAGEGAQAGGPTPPRPAPGVGRGLRAEDSPEMCGVGVRGWGPLTPRDVLMGDSLKRTLRHSSGQTPRSSAGLICSSSWPGRTPSVLTVLGGRAGVSRAGPHPQIHPAGFGGGQGGSGTTYILEKPLSISQAVTSAGEELSRRLGGLSWRGTQGEGTWGGLRSPPPPAGGARRGEGTPPNL